MKVLRLFLSIALLVSSGCRTLNSEPPPEAAPQLLPAAAWPGDFVLQQRVQLAWRGDPTHGVPPGEESFAAALQRSGDELLLVGFGPMQRVGFELRLEAGRVDFINRTGRELPFRPENILIDVQRVFYPWISKETDDAPQGASCLECEREGTRLGYRITERFAEGRLKSRSFIAPGRSAEEAIEILYSNAAAPGERVAAEVELRNREAGYTLRIETLRSDLIRDTERPSNRP